MSHQWSRQLTLCLPRHRNSGNTIVRINRDINFLGDASNEPNEPNEPNSVECTFRISLILLREIAPCSTQERSPGRIAKIAEGISRRIRRRHRGRTVREIHRGRMRSRERDREITTISGDPRPRELLSADSAIDRRGNVDPEFFPG